ncbi:MAG: VOC family protein [Chitinophagales bacterium]
MSTETIELTPYLNFDGDCEEALTFYLGILDGRIEVVSRYDEPSMKAPDEFKNKILHARFYFGNEMFFASDVMPGKSGNRSSAKLALALGLRDEVLAEKIFNQLAAGGTVGVPFVKQFWGDWHGNLVDRFGISWMVNASKREARR